MRFATVNGEKREAAKELSGLCIGCEQPMIPVCGTKKVKHWRHKVDCECDRWWENETEWHRSWKNNFPAECQEIRHRADDGEWHIADVKTKANNVLEFQHSFLNSDERQARNRFYGTNLVWVVDGLKRKNDLARFDLFLKNAKSVVQSINLARLPSPLDDCPLLKEWSECSGPVFFDFGAEFPMWCLLPRTLKGAHYIGPFSRQNFIELHNGILTKNGQTFLELMKTLTDIVFAYENPRQQTVHQQSQSLPVRQPVRQRQIVIPANLRYLFYSNRSPQRRGRRF